MSDNEVEKFEITDYDLENEFAGPRRLGRRQTKEQQIYGMWARDSDGEEDEDAAPTAPPPMSRMRVLRGGLNFIPGGIHQAGKKDKKLDKGKKDKGGSEEEEEEESEMSSRPMFMAGTDSSDEEPAATNSSRSRPSSFRGKRATSTLQSSSSKRQDIAGMRRGGLGGFGGSGGGTGPAGLLGSGVGDWEKYTSGIGSKLLKKMGFEEGKGLGKNLQGIATPVEANKRKGKGAIGYYGTERPTGKSKVPAPDSEEEEKEEYRELLQQWKKKSGSGGRKKIKYVYKSAEDVIEEGRKGLTGRGTGRTGADDSHITRTKVIDMTGPETRVLSSYHALAGRNVPYPVEEPSTRTYGHLDLPELLHNLDLLLERCEEDILSNARALERSGDRTVHLQHERTRLHALVEREQIELAGVDGALAVVEKLQSSNIENTLTLQAATDAFTSLKTDHSRVYHAFQLAHLAPTLVIPLLRTLLQSWKPLTNPTAHKDVFTTWQELVEECGEEGQGMQQPELGQPLDPYHQLMWETWAGVVREAVTTTWEPRECAPLLTLLETWPVPLVPEWVRGHLLQQVVLPRITDTVNGWDPLQDTVAIHTWLHPWLPLLADHLQTVYPVIRQKLGSALVHWHPSDRSARLVLEPWRRVFSGVSMTNLLQSSIVPKLETSLLEANIAPPANPPEAWCWFMDWEDLLPHQVILEVLDRSFFPRWYQSLATWLSSSPPHNQVIAWYKGWRSALPRSLANHLQLCQKFQQALEVCSRALAFQPGAPEQFNLLLAGLDKLSEPPPPPPLGSPPRQPQRAGPGTTKDWADIISSARRDTLSMREVVERRCQERGVVFLPLPDRTHQGRPVYRCGSRNVSFNKTIIYAQMDRGWTPTSLSSLLDDA